MDNKRKQPQDIFRPKTASGSNSACPSMVSSSTMSSTMSSSSSGSLGAYSSSLSVVAEGGPEMIQALTQAMDAFPHEERVQISCLKVMRHILPIHALAEKQPPLTHQKRLQHSDELLDLYSVVPLIFRTMKACPESPKVQFLAVAILSDLCETSIEGGGGGNGNNCHGNEHGGGFCDMIIETGGLIRLSETMTVHRRHAVAKLARRLHSRLVQNYLTPPPPPPLQHPVPFRPRQSFSTTAATSVSTMSLSLCETEEEEEEEEEDA